MQVAQRLRDGASRGDDVRDRDRAGCDAIGQRAAG